SCPLVPSGAKKAYGRTDPQLASLGSVTRSQRFSTGTVERAIGESMKRKLSEANPYLRDPNTRERTVLKSVATSSAIEGIRAPFRRAGAEGSTATAAPLRPRGRRSPAGA